MPRRIDERKVFEAVLRLWVDRGYAGTTTRQIAQHAGVNEATLFRRYGDKAKLVRMAIRRPLQTVPLRTLTATSDVEADLIQIVKSYLETNEQVGVVVPLLLMEASRHPELLPVLDIAWENMGFPIRVLEHHQARGALQEGDPFTMLIALIGPLFVVGMFRGVHLELPVIDIEGHVQAFLHGRAPGSPS